MSSLEICAKKEEVDNDERFLDRIPARHVFAILVCLSLCTLYAQRMVMHMAIVAMVNNTALEKSAPVEGSDQQCPVTELEQNITYNYRNGEYLWEPSLQGAVLSSYFYGFTSTQLIGGLIVEKIGARAVLVGTVLISSILTMTIPIGASSAAMVIVLRTMIGLAQGAAYTSVFTLFSRWTPQQERGSLIGVVWSGNTAGTITSTIITGYLCEYGFSKGWPSAFYVFGIFGCVTFAILFFLLFESPSEHPRIARKELLYIQESLYCPTSGQKNRVIPWKAILTSVPVWGIAIAKFASAWAFFTLLTKLPAYLESVLHFPIHQNGWMNAGFHLGMGISAVLSGVLADFCVKRWFSRLTIIRKCFGTLGRIGPAACLIAIPMVGCDKWSAVALIAVGLASFGPIAGGDTPMMMDIANDYAGIIFGLANGFSCLGGVFSPLVAGFILDKNVNNVTRWGIVFYSSSGMLLIGTVAFLLMCTSEPQSWSIQRPKEDNNAGNKEVGEAATKPKDESVNIHANERG